MSSEEVAELAQAIHSHADALYESWTKGPEAIRRMARMEDTLELLADPGLTPKLEHLVSTFVRRDKAKRQQSSSPSSLGSGPLISSPRQQQQSPPPIGSGIGGENVVTNIPISVTTTTTNGGSAKKPLPKSILAVVQRFEPSPSPPPSSSSTSSSSSSTTSVPSVNSVLPPPSSPPAFPALPSDPLRLAGVGNVSRNVLWAESNSRHTVTEKTFNRHINPRTNASTISSTSSTTTEENRSSISPPKIRHIPIERVDEPANPPNLIREDERLFHALRSGQVMNHHLNNNNHNSNNNLSYEALRASSPLNSSSRVAFAKERIRQSQEHPLTQQRLELQKRLPSPSSSLAAAIALQQGKIKFQPGIHHTDEDDNDHHIHHHHISSINGFSNHSKESGRHSWVSSLRFNNGASVADRVQLFEKYPAHIPPSSSISIIGGPAVTSYSSPPSAIVSPPSHINSVIGVNNGNNNGTVSIVNVSMAPAKEVSTIIAGNDIAPIRKQVLSSTPLIIDSTSNTTATTPWRNSAEHYQPDLLSSKKQKQVIGKSPSSVTPSSSVSRSFAFPPVPRFYWPEGKRAPSEYVQDAMSKAEQAVANFPPFLNYLHLGQVLSAIGIPLYWKKAIWDLLGLKNEDLLDSKRFLVFYQRLVSDCPDDETRFLSVISATARKKPLGLPKRASVNDEFKFTEYNRLYICMSDFIPMMQDIIDTHPGLGFLRDAPEFHSRYITTVISRIFYKVNRSWSGKITLQELRRSNLLRIIKRLEEETDVNTITEYFSYEHFYVIYCKFWELDKDHDLLIDKKDLQSHGDHALSTRIIDRIFDGTVIRGWDVASPVKFTPGKMTYSDFVWFLLSEEDKRTPTSIEYWFRCLDIDGDGVLSPYELQYFYEEQERRLESFGVEPLDFANVYCQMVDMLRCSPTGIRLSDLKRNPQLAANVFNTLFNLDKYLDHEQRDPFASASSLSHEAQEGESDWDKYATAEYENLIAEESPADHMHETPDFEDTGLSYSP